MHGWLAKNRNLENMRFPMEHVLYLSSKFVETFLAQTWTFQLHQLVSTTNCTANIISNSEQHRCHCALECLNTAHVKYPDFLLVLQFSDSEEM
jgi:hypothetical protein